MMLTFEGQTETTLLLQGKAVYIWAFLILPRQEGLDGIGVCNVVVKIWDSAFASFTSVFSVTVDVYPTSSFIGSILVSIAPARP